MHSKIFNDRFISDYYVTMISYGKNEFRISSHYNGRHRGPACDVTEATVTMVQCGIVRFLCATDALFVYSTFGHHPHPLGYLGAKFHFCRAPIAELACRK